MAPAGSYLAITWQLAADKVDLMLAEAWSPGFLGCEVEENPGSDCRLVAFFAGDGTDPTGAMRLPEGVHEVGRERIADQDWLRTYRKSASPIEVGERWLLDPREPLPAVTKPEHDDRILLRLPARRAFGTGGHESTRLALRLLETTPIEGRMVLDLGYGSGVLSFAAAAMGARCVALERDLTAALVGGLNRNLNPSPLPVAMIAGEASALAGACRFDVLLVNARPENWLVAGAHIAGLLCRGAEAICSGLLAEEVDDLTQQLASWGWSTEAELSENDWSALRLRAQ